MWPSNVKKSKQTQNKTKTTTILIYLIHTYTHTHVVTVSKPFLWQITDTILRKNPINNTVLVFMLVTLQTYLCN